MTDRNGNITEVDETRSREGQPYYLPKGILHLTINKTGGAEPATPEGEAPAPEAPKKPKQGAATGQTQAESEVDPVSGMPRLPTAPSNDQNTQGKASANGNAYSVSLGVDYEADASAGVFYARYSPNVMFNDQVGLQVNNKRLLHTVQAKTTDETRTIIDNLADTVTNMIQFSATKGIGLPTGRQDASLIATERPGKKLNELINIVIKDLNIDERFDPLVAGDREKIRELFRDDIGTHYALLSPLKVEFHVVEGPHGTHRSLGKSERQGLFFREPVQVEVVLTRNPKIFELARDNLTELVRLVSEAEANSETARKNQKAAQKSARERAAQKKAVEDPKKPKDPVNEQITNSSSSNKPEEGTPAEDAEVSEQDAYLVALQKKLKETENLYFRAQAGASATVGRLSAVVASKQRLYTVNIKRGAFIERTTELQVTNGVAMGIGHQKPSEVLGFTEIPLSISKKILALPKAIFSTKKDVATERNAYLKQASGGND